MVNKSTCYICGNKVDKDLTIRVPRSSKNNAIFFAAMKIYFSVASDFLHVYFENCKQSLKTICVAHYLRSTRSLLDDIVVSGGKLSRTTEDVVYINEGDIPNQLLLKLNATITTFAVDITVNARDICRYLNDYLKRYGWAQADVASFAQAEMRENSPSNDNGREEGSTEVEDVSMPPPPAVMRVDSELMRTTTASVKRGDSGTSKATSGSHFSPGNIASEDDSDDADNIQRLPPTKPELMDRYFLVQGKALLELFRLCRCGCSNDDEPGTVQLEEEGSAPIITYLTKEDRSRKRRWRGQEKIGSRPSDKRLTGNAKTCVAAATTGLRITKLLKWAEEANIALPSRSAFYDVFKALRPSIAQVYERHQNEVIQIIRNAYEREGQSHGWDIAVDGAFDSRGFSADFCKVLAVDLKTNLCIYTELVHRSETAGVSGKMEKEGFHRLLRWLRSRCIEINSISTDRSTVYGTEIRQFNAEFNTDIKWFLDPWHLARNLYKNLRTAAKRTGCGDLRRWIDPLKAHLYDAVRKGAAAKNGDVIRQTFNSCLFHTADIHEWAEDAITGPITRCGHEPITERDKPVLATGSIAHNTLKTIVLNPVFQKDLTLTSHLGGTSQCEAKNSLDRLYCPKDVYLPAPTYNFYVKLSTLHKNALTLAEMRGERTVRREFDTTRKFNDRPSHMVEKTPIEHVWRREIYVQYITNNYPQPAIEEAMDET